MRWAILSVLALARFSMAFAFQSVAALGAFLLAERGVSYAGLGTLVGIFLVTGVAFAIPGARLAERFGDRRVIIAAATLLALGAGALAVASGQGQMVAARLVAGVGGVLINVLVTKMTADWFPRQGNVFAMGVIVGTWPLGLALAMVALPPLAARHGVDAALAVPAAAAALAAVLLVAVYRPAPGAAPPAAVPAPLSRRDSAITWTAGGIWAFLNLGLILTISFGPDLAAAQGASPEAATARYSLIGWLTVPAMLGLAPLVARSGRTVLPLALGLSGILLGTFLLWPLGPNLTLLVCLGLAIGLSAPIVMSLPATEIAGPKRARAFGLYFTIYYVAMGLVPPLTGWLRDVTAAAAAPLWVSLAAHGLALICLALYLRARRVAA